MTGQYDVVFIIHNGKSVQATQLLAQNVNRAEADRVALRHRSTKVRNVTEGVRVIHHGTLKQAVETVLWH